MRLAQIVAAVLIGSGCGGTEPLVTSMAEGGGTTVEYPVTPAQAFDISVAILRWEGALIFNERRDQGTVLVDGDSAGAFVNEGSAPGMSKVTVVARRDFSEAVFHQDFRRAVQIVQSGRSLPDARPVNEAR